MPKFRKRVAAASVEASDDPVARDSAPPPKRVNIPLPKGWKRADEALDRVEAVSTIFPDFNRASGCGGLPVNRMHTFHGPTHGGKANALDTKILTPSGWRVFGELRVGDAVTGRDGTAYKVTGVYPQGVKPLYRVIFSDGTSATCCDEHLWYTTTKGEWYRGSHIRGPRPERARTATGRHGEGSVKSLNEIRQTIEASHEIPLVEPVHFDERPDLSEMCLDPYVLGLLLGDGGFTGGCLRFTKPEVDLQEAVVRGLLGDDTAVHEDPMTLRIRGGATLKELRRLGLRGLLSHEKFIPDPYMFAAPGDRFGLLCGLFDTDGYVVRDGERIEYGTSSKRLAEQVVELARGLGAYVTSDSRIPTYSYNDEKREGRLAYRINVYWENRVPVRSAKHLAKWIGRADKQRIRRTIVAVEQISPRECQCISVSSPDNLYVIDEYLVTHNTGLLLGFIKSFLDGGHVAAYIDAEHSTPLEFAEELLGELHGCDRFFGTRPDTYEETIEAVNQFLLMMVELRKQRPDIKSIIGVDSINKLTPKRELAGVLKAGGGVELSKGHAGRYRAAINQAWLNHLSPRLKAAGCAMCFIAQERDNGDEPWAPDGGVEIKGGQALSFDASLLIRVSKALPMRDPSTAKKEGDKGEIIGFQHRARIYKSKVGHMDGAFSDCVFHFSNGKQTPAGFDVQRDALYVAKKLGLTQASGSWISWRKHRWQGEMRAAKWLAEHPAATIEMLGQIEQHLAASRVRTK